MKNILFISLIVFLFACQGPTHTQSPMPLNYPQTEKVDQVDTYFGTQVPDPYRWLEFDTAANVGEWVKAQNRVTSSFLEKIPSRGKLKARYKQLLDYPKMYGVTMAGENIFFYKNDGLQNQAVLYIQKGLEGEPEVFIDPNKESEAGTITFNLTSISRDNRYAVIAKSEGGSDWSELQIWDIATQKPINETINWVKFSSVSWYKNGFFYTRYPQPEAGHELSAATEYSKIYYHTIGTSPESDELIFEDNSHPNRYNNISVTRDEAYLILYISTGTNGFETHYKKLGTPGWKFTPLFSGFDHKSRVLRHNNDSFMVMTDVDAPNKKLVSIDLSKPESQNWKTILPEKKEVLEGVSLSEDHLFVEYLENATSKVYKYDLDGKNQKVFPLPGPGTVAMGGVRKGNPYLFYSFTSFTSPGSIYRYDLATEETHTFFATPLNGFDADVYESKQVFYKSKDGTEVPMFLVYKKGIVLDGSNPTYLYAYGGFNVNLTPGFSSSRLLLLENGGVFAMPNLRGGGEFGEEWHRAGMLYKKQNVFDDFISAAEYLIKEGYTSPENLAIAGGSNGGLLVGAVMNQRPELFRVAFPAVGVMDMLRYHKFTVGWGWVPEYGSSDESKKMFTYLMGYSPIHNIKKDLPYPATMVTTADHDDRVVPAHSFKYIATLQEAYKGNNPVLIQIATDAGHGAGKPTEKILEEEADKWAFMFFNMGKDL